MKRITALFLSLTMLLALSACGSPQAEQPGAPSPTPEMTPTPTPEAAPSETPKADGSRVLVAYFSATGNTETLAGHLAETLSANAYAITPETPYTSDDLNWRDETSRSLQEHNDISIRPAISGGVEDMDEYDVIFLGYPLWWGDAPLIVRTFLESYDFTGKTIVPFCTSSSSGFGDSGKNLEEFAPDALWQDGERFTGSSAQDDVAEWVETLDSERMERRVTMSKSILILSGSPRKGGNPDLLCDEFLCGAQESGHQVEKIFLRDKKVAPCNACYYCIKSSGKCAIQDDMGEILDKMQSADVIVMASPVYFYSIDAQMKAVIDRSVARWTDIPNKEFYYIMTAAEDSDTVMDCTLECFRGFAACLKGAKEKGVIYGKGVYEAGAVKGLPVMKEAYEMGRQV